MSHAPEIIAATVVATVMSAGAVMAWLQRGNAMPFGVCSLALALYVTTAALGAWAAVYWLATS
jgi:hypothetical protein